MTEPIWIDEASVRKAHAKQLAEHGGADGLRDLQLLASSLTRPRNLFAYGDPSPDLADLAAAYAFGIARNHPFFDGNKRTAFVICIGFLRINGFDIAAATEDEHYSVFLNLATGALTQEALATWIRERLAPWREPTAE